MSESKDIKKLFSYKPFNQLEHLTQLKNYMNQKVWFTRLGDFNDPFEGRLQFKMADPEQILKNDKLLNKYYELFKSEYPDLTIEYFKDELRKPDAKNYIGKIVKQNDRFLDHGAICLTGTNSNMPMWAHYANNHQGYCLVFEIDLNFIREKIRKSLISMYPQYSKISYDFERYFRNVFEPGQDISEQDVLVITQPADDPDKTIYFFKVRYSDTPSSVMEVNLNDFLYEREKHILLNSAGLKFKQWEYEQEYRLLVNANSKVCGLMDLRGYPFIKITGVILGEKFCTNPSKDLIDFIHNYQLQGHHFSSQTVEGKIKEYITCLSREHNIQLYMAKCSESKYETEITKLMS